MIPRALLCALVCLGCSCDLVSKAKITLPPVPPIDGVLSLPKTIDGKYLLMELSNARLEVDPTVRDSLTSLGDCVDQIVYCYQPDTRALDDCVRGVRTCTTGQPWVEPVPCCPQKCQEDYAALRTQGIDSTGALDKVFFVDHTCFPGVSAALEGM